MAKLTTLVFTIFMALLGMVLGCVQSKARTDTVGVLHGTGLLVRLADRLS